MPDYQPILPHRHIGKARHPGLFLRAPRSRRERMLQALKASYPPARDARRERLLEIIKANSLLPRPEFTLASGQRSNFFFDMKKTMFLPEGASLAADLIFGLMAADTDVEAV